MDLILKGDCEKIIFTQGKERIVLYNGDKIQIHSQIPISLSSVVTQKSEIWKHICKFPFLLIGAIFNILLMNFEWDWIDNFEPCAFLFENYICKSSDIIEIEYIKSRFNKQNQKIILPQMNINGKSMKIKNCVYTEDLKVCFFKCCVRIFCILMWCIVPLTIIMMNAGKYSSYVLLINICILISVIVKMLFEYRKYRILKKQIYFYEIKN